MSIILSKLFYIQIIKNEFYKDKLVSLTEKIVYGSTAPRGRIYDRNGVVIVDNKPVKVIYYQKKVGASIKEELDIAKKLSQILEVDYSKVNDRILKEYYLKLHSDLDLITKAEYESYKNRQISSSQLYELKLERITSKQLESIDKETAYIYYLMNNGYSYTEKIIKNKNVTELEYAVVAESVSKIPGVGIRLDWERVYPYGTSLRGILGSVGNIPNEYKDQFLKNGYTINDVVGISYLEYQYDSYLKGTKNKYLVHANGNYELIEEGKKGNDLYLNIDIKLQQEIENIIVENIKRAKSEPNTQYLNKTFVIVTDAKTGGIIAMAGKQVVGDDVYDYSSGVINSSYVVGSVVKGASHIVGYNTGALKIGEVRVDDCIKIKSTPEKCSFMYLGTLNDLTALKRSSNTYQFHTAIKVGGGTYCYNCGLALNPDAFNTYRNVFKQFGLGVKTDIDLPSEKLGVTGKKTDSGLLLDLAIGQYDTYTPIELSQYITTIANSGIRIKPYILDKVIDSKGKTIYQSKRTELNTVTTDSIYMKRIQEGFKEVLEYGGTGSGYIDLSKKPAGKTGTSQSFLDTNGDGKADTETISTTFVSYLPYDDPKVTFTIVTPDTSTYSDTEYTSFITKRIAQQVTNTYFKSY
jgi:cell division protein FtsI/penicillin-binding protein 2